MLPDEFALHSLGCLIALPLHAGEFLLAFLERGSRTCCHIDLLDERAAAVTRFGFQCRNSAVDFCRIRYLDERKPARTAEGLLPVCLSVCLATRGRTRLCQVVAGRLKGDFIVTGL